MTRFLFALCCLVSSVQAQTLMVLGDSLSAGYQMPADQSWPALLNQKWQQQGGEHQLINASISGETTQGALARLPALLKEHKPDWVLIELGGNDGLRGFAPAITRDNLARMVALTTELQVKTVLTQIQLPRNYGARYLRQFEQIFPELAAANALPLMPFFMDDIALRPELMMNDGIHPTAAAQPLIRDRVASFIEPLLTQYCPQYPPIRTIGPCRPKTKIPPKRDLCFHDHQRSSIWRNRSCATPTSRSGWNLEMKRSHPTFLTMASLKLPLREVLSVMKRSDMRASLRISWVRR